MHLRNHPFEQPPLPWDEHALEPYVSASTIQFHYGKHHAGYYANLNKVVSGTDMKDMPLEQLVLEAYKSTNIMAFNNGAQAWNHNFFWDCMKPKGGSKPSAELQGQIERSFGSYHEFEKEFKLCTSEQITFGSGWVWLVADKNKSLSILATKDADNPITKGLAPLLTIDLWEHAYYLDYQNRRPEFVDAYLHHLVNWSFAEENFKNAHASGRI